MTQLATATLCAGLIQMAGGAAGASTQIGIATLGGIDRATLLRGSQW
jgi:hypothetical protein